MSEDRISVGIGECGESCISRCGDLLAQLAVLATRDESLDFVSDT